MEGLDLRRVPPPRQRAGEEEVLEQRPGLKHRLEEFPLLRKSPPFSDGVDDHRRLIGGGIDVGGDEEVDVGEFRGGDGVEEGIDGGGSVGVEIVGLRRTIRFSDARIRLRRRES